MSSKTKETTKKSRRPKTDGSESAKAFIEAAAANWRSMNMPTTDPLDQEAKSAAIIYRLSSEALMGICQKQKRKPSELHHSAKLWRVIDDLSQIETASKTLRLHLEKITGWDVTRD